jgi:hypothetical protein
MASKKRAKDASSNGPKKQKRAPVRVTCTATKRNGKPCGLPPIKGGTVCHKHGGSAPQVRKRANQRLIEMVLPAMKELHRILDSPNTADADKLRAIQMVLNRTGYGERTQVDIGLREPTPWDNLTSAGVRVIRGRDAIVDDDDRPALDGGGGDEFDLYNSSQRAELDDSVVRVDNRGHEVVPGSVQRPAMDPFERERKERAASRRPTEFDRDGTRPAEKSWTAYERRVQEGQE